MRTAGIIPPSEGERALVPVAARLLRKAGGLRRYDSEERPHSAIGSIPPDHAGKLSR